VFSISASASDRDSDRADGYPPGPSSVRLVIPCGKRNTDVGERKDELAEMTCDLPKNIIGYDPAGETSCV
jgi:hypothetical protein